MEALRTLLRSLARHWVLIFSVAGIAALVVAVNPGKLWNVFLRSDPVSVALMVPATILVAFLTSFSWWITLRRISMKVTFARVLQVMLASRIFVLLPLGGITRVALLPEEYLGGIDAGEITGTIAFQELIYLGLMGFALVPVLLQLPGSSALVVIILFLLEIAIFVIIFWARLFDFMIRLVERIRFLQRFDTELRHIRPTFIRLLEWKTTLGVLVVNSAGVFLQFVIFVLALHAVGATGVSLQVAAFIYALSYVASALTLLPAGLGAYEGMVTGFIVLQGIPAATGAAAAILYRGLFDVLLALLGLPALALLPSRNSAPPRVTGDEPLSA